MEQPLPELAFVELDKLAPHEHNEARRTRSLARRIRNSGAFLNPPVVTPFADGSGRYLVLDGANRTHALRLLGYPHALVQVVQTRDPGLSLTNWNHAVWEMDPKRLWERLEAIPGIRLARLEGVAPEPELLGENGPAQLILPNGERYLAGLASREAAHRIDLLHAIVACYHDSARLDRTNVNSVAPLEAIYPELAGLVIFPKFSLAQLLELVAQGFLLPTGITRFTISPRALHLNYPLEELAAATSLEEKDKRLQKWLRERVARTSIRYYAEATFLFDE